jgi:DMSO/TMAO reductase YedYZ molybdopterin-dependent catalytic subunit
MTHQCPRPECSRSVPDDMFACRGDWYALPARLREAIWRGYRSTDVIAHAEAMAAAREWYREHPPAYARREGMAQRYVREER